MHPVVAETAEDDVVVGELERRLIGRRIRRRVPCRIDTERRDVDRLLQRAAQVDRVDLHVTGRRDRLVQRVAVVVFQIRVDWQKRHDAVERFALADQIPGIGRIAAQAVAAGVNPAVVADDPIVPGTAGDKIVAIAADDIVALPFAEKDVATLGAIDEVVTGLAVDFVVAADIGLRLREVEVGPARRVVDQSHRPRHDSHGVGTRGRVVIVIVEPQEPVGGLDRVAGQTRVAAYHQRTDRWGDLPVDSDQTDDIAVVACDSIGVGCMPVRRRRDVAVRVDRRGVQRIGRGADIADIVACDFRSRAAKDQVRAVRPLRGRQQVEHVGTAADQIVLILVAEQNVAAAAALDVILAVAGQID